jgi:syringate O-demethylase
MSPSSLQDVLDAAESPVAMLRDSQSGPNVYPGIPPEFTNWRDEQLAWQHTCVLFHQTFHMAELAVRGPDALKLLSDTGVNSFANFPVNKAKEFVPVTPEGYVIGDVILFHLGEHEFNLVGRAPVLNWLTFQAQKGEYDVELAFDQRTALRSDGRRASYRFQVQGPLAMDTLGRALGRTPPQIAFFNMQTVRIAGRDVRALRHGMAGQPGWELFGPFDDYAAVLEALLAAGEDFGLRQVGSRAYSSNALESAWIPSPMPAVYSGESLREYREWLPATGYEANASVGGSFTSEVIEEYYFTPWDLGYGQLVKFDHDFIGHAALARMTEREHRHKVTLALEDEDVKYVLGSMFGEQPAKFIDWPSAVYCMHPFDQVIGPEGEPAGVSTWIGYSANERKMLTLATVEESCAEPGTLVTLLWGEPGGGTPKPTVERHVQTEIRARVTPAPYVSEVRRAYAPSGWRGGGA